MLQYLALAFLAVASADVVYDGVCPEVTPLENFDLSAYQGLWYEVARYPYRIEQGAKGKCTTADYIINGNQGKVKNSHVVDGVKSYFEADLALAGPGKLTLTYTVDGKRIPYTIYVLDTDYKNYAITYICKYFSETNKHQVVSWIKSRSKTLGPAAKEAVDNYIKSSNLIKSSDFVTDDQSETGCSAFY